MAFELPRLPYAFDALEPHMDAMTMQVHHGKHHQGYINQLNQALAGTSLEGDAIEDILSHVSQHAEAIRNNGGGHYNHTLFWTILSAQGGGTPTGALAEAIDAQFGGFEQFRESFTNTAATRFGSGWAWLYANDQGELNICSTPNQDNPLMDVVPAAHRGVPILGLDVWEHAYYLNYQNKRTAYIAAFWNLVNWQEVAERFQAIL